MSDIIKNIKENIPNLSKSNKRIAHFIIENVEDAAFLTAAKIAKEVGVSESTVVRFATTLGFDGFPQLQREISDFLKQKLHSPAKIDFENTNLKGSALVKKIMTDDSNRLLDSLNMIDETAFNAAVSMISKARKVYVVGVRSCEALASFFSFYLRMIVDDVVLISTSSSSEIFEQMININERDVLVGISFPRYSMRTLKAMEFANNRNAGVIAITDSIHSPMNLYSSCNLFSKCSMAKLVDSLVAPMSLINSLIIALCIENSQKTVKRMEELEMVWNDYQVAANDEINYLDEELISDLKGLV